jgi:hypothetical protein
VTFASSRASVKSAVDAQFICTLPVFLIGCMECGKTVAVGHQDYAAGLRQ